MIHDTPHQHHMHLALILCTTLLIVWHVPVSLGASAVIDDSDQRIQYTGSWISHAALNKSQYWDGTVTHSDESGATAEITFNGSSVSVRGAYAPVGTFNMSSRYTLDKHDPPVQFDPPDAVTHEAFSVYFYESKSIPYGQHVLLIENLGEQFWLDSIVVGIPNNVSNATEATQTQAPKQSTQSPTAITATLSGTTLSTFTSDISPSTSTANTAESSANATTRSSVVIPGVAAGAAVGGTLVSVAILSGGLMWWRRRRRDERKLGGEEAATTALTPYVFSMPTDSRGGMIPRMAKGGSMLRPLEVARGLPSEGRAHTYNDVLSSHGPRELGYCEPKGYTLAAEKPGRFSLGISEPSPEYLATSTYPSLDGLDRDQDVERGSTSCPRSSTTIAARRRSLDGGLRIVGSPGTVQSLPVTEVVSPASTLPPIYDLYQ
ncbi:hypothetical protein C8Q70DRAFT_1039463 [Cubamyces menziesii]|nr:hypothetical protein C8Q70DRAFT_1039463 [Cubamyces menziesii]